MRILFINNLFPPCKYGWGYMQLCEEVANGLYNNGHTIAILTSNYKHGDDSSIPYDVYRILNLDPDWYSGKSAGRQFFFGRRARERDAIANLKSLNLKFKPDNSVS